MVNLLNASFSSDNTGTVCLRDGRELNQTDAFIVDKNTYRRFLEWEKSNIQDRFDYIQEEMQSLEMEYVKAQSNAKRITRELEQI